MSLYSTAFISHLPTSLYTQYCFKVTTKSKYHQYLTFHITEGPWVVITILTQFIFPLILIVVI